MMRRVIFVLLFIGTAGVVAESQTFSIHRDQDAGQFTLMEQDQPVYTFNYKPQLREGVDEKYRRAGYFHPIYDLDGKPITDDFPEGQPHHRGMWLSWPWMKYEGNKVQLWHPSPLKQVFDRVVDQKLTEDKARIVLRNNWVLKGEVIGRETWVVTAYTRSKQVRVIDVTLSVEASKKPIKVRGKQNNNKGYGGLTVRTHPSLKGVRMLTNKGYRTKDAVNEEFHWADLSTDRQGIAVLVHPSNPGAPQPWLLRNSYGGVLNPEWPGLDTKTLRPGNPVKLKYRLIVHKGRLEANEIQKLLETGAW